MKLIPKSDFDRLLKTKSDWRTVLPIVSNMCRLNTLTSITLAGSGHLGSSFSSMDIFVWALHHKLNTLALGFDNPNRDIFFSSKGHDAPALYSVLFSAGIVSMEALTKLRRLGGLHGHPDISNAGIEANSGSLGMGISKARGIAWAKKYSGLKGRVFVLLGDGELQEGQIYEGLQGAAKQGLSNLTVIVDHNKIQTDKNVKHITYTGDLLARFEAFGWNAYRCDGNDISELDTIYTESAKTSSNPSIILADTIKGKGVSFMESSHDQMEEDDVYQWHAGAPNKDEYELAYQEILGGIVESLRNISDVSLNLVDLQDSSISRDGLLLGEQFSAQKIQHSTNNEKEFLVNAFGQELIEIGRKRRDLVVLDADLAADLRLREFERQFPNRFIEVGIAEQDMVSMAGGIALQGLLPIVNSFGAFLAARANEQIYNNATEESKIIYVCHYAGLIPAGPGKSHQSIRDISLFGALPNALIAHPSCEQETKLIFRYLVNSATGCCVLRLPLGPSSLGLKIDKLDNPIPGIGWTFVEGKDAVLFTYGPHMLNEALVASNILRESTGIHLRVINLPWLNKINHDWLVTATRDVNFVFVLEDHSTVGGLGDNLTREIASSVDLTGKLVTQLSLTSFPECGDPDEVLQYHGLDSKSISSAIKRVMTQL